MNGILIKMGSLHLQTYLINHINEFGGNVLSVGMSGVLLYLAAVTVSGVQGVVLKGWSMFEIKDIWIHTGLSLMQTRPFF